MPSIRALRLASAVAVVCAGSNLGGFAFAQDAPKTHMVEISQFAFQPALLRLKRGDTVAFTNKDVAPHTATATSQAWDSATLVNGKSWSLKLDAAGEIDYFCRFHPNMKAKLIVE